MRILPGQCRQGTAPGDQDAISDQRCSPARLGPADGNIGRQTPWASATSRGPAVAPWRWELMSLSLPRGSVRCSPKCCKLRAERQALQRTSTIRSCASVTPNRRSFVPMSGTELYRPPPARAGIKGFLSRRSAAVVRAAPLCPPDGKIPVPTRLCARRDQQFGRCPPAEWR